MTRPAGMSDRSRGRRPGPPPGRPRHRRGRRTRRPAPRPPGPRGCRAGRGRCRRAPSASAASMASRTRSPDASRELHDADDRHVAAGHAGPARRVDVDVLADDVELRARSRLTGSLDAEAHAACPAAPRTRPARSSSGSRDVSTSIDADDDVARSQAGTVGRRAVDDGDDERRAGSAGRGRRRCPGRGRRGRPVPPRTPRP